MDNLAGPTAACRQPCSGCQQSACIPCAPRSAHLEITESQPKMVGNRSSKSHLTHDRSSQSPDRGACSLAAQRTASSSSNLVPASRYDEAAAPRSPAERTGTCSSQQVCHSQIKIAFHYLNGRFGGRRRSGEGTVRPEVPPVHGEAAWAAVSWVVLRLCQGQKRGVPAAIKTCPNRSATHKQQNVVRTYSET